MKKNSDPAGTDNSTVYDESFYKGEKGSYTDGGYIFKVEYDKFAPLAKTLQQFGAKKALDIGCATGPLVKALLDSGVDAYGVDVSEWAVKHSVVADRLTRLNIEKENIPFANDSFDLITMSFVVEHLHSPEDALKKVFRVLKPGGLLFIKTDNPKECFQNQAGHINVRPKKSWLHLLKSINFEPLGVTYVHFIVRYLYNGINFGHLARKLLLHKMGIFGKVVCWFFNIFYYLRGNSISYYLTGDSNILLVRKSK